MHTPSTLTVEEAYEAEKKRIYNKITVRRSMLSPGKVRPEGFIFYNITLVDGMRQKFTGSRLIDLDKENRLGMDAIVDNIKKELAAKYFKFE